MVPLAGDLDMSMGAPNKISPDKRNQEIIGVTENTMSSDQLTLVNNDAFSRKLVQLAAMMILSKHVPSLERLKHYQFGECLLEESSFSLLSQGIKQIRMEVMVLQMEDGDS
jgi:hypothetical protein